MRCFVFFMVAAVTVAGQNTPAEKKSSDKKPSTATLLDLAKRASPELFADTVITLVEQGDLADDRRQALLEQAFDAAKRATQPVALAPIPGSADTRAMLLEQAGNLGLDSLSLEKRILELVARTDAAKARQMFETIPHPAIEARPCEDPLVADPAAYYQMAAAVAPQDLLQVVAQSNSPAGLANFITALAGLPGLTSDQLRLLGGALALKLQMPAPDFRSFALTAAPMERGLEALSRKALELGIPEGQPMDELRAGVRKFAVTEFVMPRCEEEFVEANGFIDWFNGRFRGKESKVEFTEMVPPRKLGRAVSLVYFSEGQGEKLSKEFQALRSARGTDAWKAKLASFLTAFEAWKPEGKPIDGFHQKLIVLHGLYQLSAAGAERDQMRTRVVALLKSGSFEREFPAEWLLEVKSLADTPFDEKPRLIQAFQDSGDPGLELFAGLSRRLSGENVPQ